MKVSAKEECGLLAMVGIAKKYNQGVISLNEIAADQDISLDYLEKIMPNLKAANLVKSTRGARGGYVLTRSPSEIAVADILLALSGNILIAQCVGEQVSVGKQISQKECPRKNIGPIRPVLQLLYDRIIETLNNITLADLHCSGIQE